MGKKRKLYITFDEQKRKDYLTGFHKRKLDRQAKARIENEAALKEEINKVKNSYRQELLDKIKSVPLPNFLADDLNVVTSRYIKDAGPHTVSVEEIDLCQSHYFMGDNSEIGEVNGTGSKPTAIGQKCSLKKALKMNPRKSKFRRLAQKRRAMGMKSKLK